MEIVPSLPREVQDAATRLAEIARSLASEHGRAAYGEPSRGLTPWGIYGDAEAFEALAKARRAYKIMTIILRNLKVVD